MEVKIFFARKLERCRFRHRTGFVHFLPFPPRPIHHPQSPVLGEGEEGRDLFTIAPNLLVPTHRHAHICQPPSLHKEKHSGRRGAQAPNPSRCPPFSRNSSWAFPSSLLLLSPRDTCKGTEYLHSTDDFSVHQLTGSVFFIITKNMTVKNMLETDSVACIKRKLGYCLESMYLVGKGPF